MEIAECEGEKIMALQQTLGHLALPPRLVGHRDSGGLAGLEERLRQLHMINKHYGSIESSSPGSTLFRRMCAPTPDCPPAAACASGPLPTSG
jgi:hypothetical protein